MRIICFCNNWAGLQVLNFLRAQGEDIACVVMHPPARQKYGAEIAAAAASPIIDASGLREPGTIETIRKLAPQIGVSAYFGYILKRPVLDLLPMDCINLHPALLPYNRGAHPNVWSIVDGTPAGVTLHYVDEGVDTGDIIAQAQVSCDLIDTGETLYRKLERASVDLFAATWPRVRKGRTTRTRQDRGAGTSHRVKELERLAEIDLNRTYPAGKLLDLIRAQTFPAYGGAWFRYQGRKISLRVSFHEEGEPSNVSRD